MESDLAKGFRGGAGCSSNVGVPEFVLFRAAEVAVEDIYADL